LGATSHMEPHPATLLGAVDMPPLEVAQLYLTLADGGFHAPLRSIRSVIAADGRPLKRYGLAVEQRFDPATVFLLNHALARVVSSGTARSLAAILPQAAAGKTGTSDNLRDSWFAGFTGDRVAVTWLGRDDNSSTGLTGASGALEVWGRVMGAINAKPLELSPPPGITWAQVESGQYQGSDRDEWSTATLPFRRGTMPPNLKASDREGSASAPGATLGDRIKKFLGW
ncbi:MAG: penicillin-binding transpeptidase domain-containing protein, partial [Desulfobulbaceae bacterium]|nr:penicillin-binding transpeptidase domain-containing protein [Desulfobulbaceae bacterium]